jgi:hypothetical protein
MADQNLRAWPPAFAFFKGCCLWVSAANKQTFIAAAMAFIKPTHDRIPEDALICFPPAAFAAGMQKLIQSNREPGRPSHG